MFQNNAQFLEACKSQMASLQREYNSKMQELNANMRNYNPYTNPAYNPYMQPTQQYTAPVQPVLQEVITPVAAPAVEQAAPVVPVDLRILAILGEIKSLVSEMKESKVVVESPKASGAGSMVESVPSTETQQTNKDAQSKE